MRWSIHFSRACAVFGLVAGVGLAAPAITNADPAPAPMPTPSPLNHTPLNHAIDTLAANNGDQTSRNAAEAIIKAGANQAATASGVMTAYQTSVQTLQKLGIAPFLYPTAAAFCSKDAGLPLDAVPAAAGAVPGPWPKLQMPAFGEVDAVKSGQTLFAFVPYGLESDGAKTDGMQVAWFNLSTLKGGFAPMGTIAQTAEAAIPPTLPTALRPVVASAIRTFLAASVPIGGVRAVPVETGQGTVLAAVFGTLQNGDQSCFFFPTVGITQVG